ncbi:hypothetical protein [Streptococcus sp. NLN76]|uniref:hypothetical protein n=1 Tax=Streptococcus sp. NLN76 TaxID=2822800 RepID=UPI0018A8FFAE|nr:hypothetical protein [Streptococcus sp. NLN76]MBF8971119.1 hypothetical protein [Streptococcus sp. NLN76]
MKKVALVCFLLLMTASIIYPLREYLGYTNLLYWLISSAVFFGRLPNLPLVYREGFRG